MNFLNSNVLFLLNSILLVKLTKQQIVNTTSGTVRGQTIVFSGHKIDQYLGIPYAVPPLWSLRFAKPKPIEKPIEGIIDATKPKNSCLQPFTPPIGYFKGVNEKSEDCLVLNIWTQQQNSTAHKLKPVMFWIYGGALFFGSIFQTAFNATVLATHDVVFVSVNYRIGWFGFLYGGDESAPGNVGFFDQNLGLKWVRENIHLFGGDKNQITIFGESAGSWSVGAHILSPISQGLFKRAIMMSGAYLFNKDRPVVSKEEALIKAKKLAKHFGCEDNKNWLFCLRAQDSKDLRWYSYDIVYPIVDTEFLPLMARTALEQGDFNYDLLAGFTRNEGSVLVYLFAKEFLLVPYYHPLVFNYYLDKIDYEMHNIDKNKLAKYYLNNTNLHNSTAIKQRIVKLTSHFAMKCPTYRFAKLYAEHSPKETNVFFYELDHKTYDLLPGLNIPLLTKLKLDPLAAINSDVGVYHTAEIPLIFGHPFLFPNTASREDTEFTKQYMKQITDFAKNGKPDPTWPPLVGTNEFASMDLIRNLSPHQESSYTTNLLESSCNGVWKDYF